jgi:hypothetical protein
MAANPYAMFNNKLVDFLEDLKGVIGHLPDYTILLSSAKFLAQFKERQNQELFERYVNQPYGSLIVARNEAFLLDEKYSNSKSDIVSLLKNVWATMQDADKESVWAHMHVLVVLSQRCLSSHR